MTLRIKDWDLHFENNRTRELKNLMWVPFPNNHDGDGFTELISNKNGLAIFGAWVLIVQVASKCDPRGTLLRGNKKDHNSASLSRMTRGSEQTLKQAIPILLNIGWLEEIDLKTGIPQEGAIIPHEGAQKGREGNGMEGKGNNTQRVKKFIPPTLIEIESYIKSKNHNVNPQVFFDYFEAGNWHDSQGKQVKSWKQKLITWNSKAKSNQNKALTFAEQDELNRKNLKKSIQKEIDYGRNRRLEQEKQLKYGKDRAIQS